MKICKGVAKLESAYFSLFIVEKIGDIEFYLILQNLYFLLYAIINFNYYRI